MNGRPRTRLSVRLGLSILPAALLVVGGLLWLQYRMARETILSSVAQEMDSLARRTANEVDDVFDQSARDVLTLSETPLIVDYDRNVSYHLTYEAEIYRKELENYLQRFADRSRSYPLILYLDKKGRELCRVGSRAGTFPAVDFKAASGAPGDKPWVSSVESVEGLGPVIFYAKPIRGELDDLSGMLVLAYDVGRLRAKLAAVPAGRHGRAFIRTSKGEIIAARPPIDHIGLLSASSPLSVKPWTVVVEAPPRDFLAPLQFFQRAAAVTAVGGAAVLIGLILFLVRAITRPIDRLVAAARAIGEGDFTYRIREHSSDEIGALSVAFNEMGEQLEKKRLEAVELQSQLIQSEKLSAVGQLISAVAHELNNPLTVISGYIQMAQSDPSGQRLRQNLDRLYDNAWRCRKVVENLLFFVRKSAHERTLVDLNGAARTAVDLLEYRLLKTDDVRVVLELSTTPLEVSADFQQIVQVLVNLIGNACDAMEKAERHPPDRRLVVRTGAALGNAFIEIEDNGTGFPEDLADRIFQPFFTTKEAGRGTGLGLPICRQIARAHGGELSARSRPGFGSVFRLELPAAASAAAPPDESDFPEELDAVPGKRVLVVDDEKDIVDVIAGLVREDGCEAVAAFDGNEALELLGARRFDLIVADVQMGKRSGMDLYESLAASGRIPANKLLFVTGDVLNPKVLEFLARTKAPYVAKPFDVHELKQAMRRMLAEGSLEPN